MIGNIDTYNENRRFLWFCTGKICDENKIYYYTNASQEDPRDRGRGGFLSISSFKGNSKIIIEYCILKTLSIFYEGTTRGVQSLHNTIRAV